MNAKGRRIDLVKIIKGVVTSYDEKGNVYKLTRTQRILFLKYKSVNFFDDVMKEFSNDRILGPYFRIEKDGEIVYEQ